MAVAITSTVNLIFGSQVMDEVTGIIFNDEVRFSDWYRTTEGNQFPQMDDFSTPGTPNSFGLYPSPCTPPSTSLFSITNLN